MKRPPHAPPATASPPVPFDPASPRTPGRALPRGLSAFRHRDYRIFWFAQLVSLSGTWMQSLAQSWLVLSLTGSALQLGLINVFQFGPSLILGLPGGVLADRVPKRRLLMATQTSAGLLAATLAVLVASGRVELWHIYAVALGFGLVNAVDMPTRQAFVTDMVGRDDLQNAVALNSALFNATRVLGPALAGVFLARVGTALLFALNAVSYAPVVVGLGAMRSEGAPSQEVAGASPLAHLREGLAYVRGAPEILLPIVVVGFVGTFGMNFAVWVPLLARNEFAAGPQGFGLLMSALGVGSLAGALTLAFFGRRTQRRLMLATAVAFGVAEVGLALAATLGAPLLAALPLMGLIGVCMSTTMALANTTVQTNAPDALRGRVMSIYMTVFAGAAPIGAAVAGLLAGALGTPVAVAAGGLLVVAATTGIALRGDRLGAARLRTEGGTG